MHNNSFVSESRKLPVAADLKCVALGFELWSEAIENSGPVAHGPDIRRLLEALFGNSPFLTQCAVAEPVFTCRLMEEGPDAVFASVMKDLTQTREGHLSDVQLSEILRICKRRIALSIAVADITGAWSLEKVTASLTDFAADALSCATAFMLRDAANNGAITLVHENDPEKDSGLIILAMGKMGARELNYSSDIDLIVFYDPEKVQTDFPDKL